MTKTEYALDIQDALAAASDITLAAQLHDMRDAIKATHRLDLIALFDTLFVSPKPGVTLTPSQQTKAVNAYKQAKLNWNSPNFKAKLADARKGTEFANPLYETLPEDAPTRKYSVISYATDSDGVQAGKATVWSFDEEWAATLTFQEEESDWLHSHSDTKVHRHGTKWARHYTITHPDGHTSGWVVKLAKNSL